MLAGEKNRLIPKWVLGSHESQNRNERGKHRRGKQRWHKNINKMDKTLATPTIKNKTKKKPLKSEMKTLKLASQKYEES